MGGGAVGGGAVARMGWPDLVRGVDERDERACRDGLRDARPLRRRRVDARRVVRARVQQHDGAGRQRLECGHHLFEGEAAGARVIVGVVGDGQPDLGEDVGVDRPRRRGKVHRRARPEHLQHARREVQPARARDALRGHDAALLERRCDRVAQQQPERELAEP